MQILVICMGIVMVTVFRRLESITEDLLIDVNLLTEFLLYAIFFFHFKVVLE
jgi:hypothetical protein